VLGKPLSDGIRYRPLEKPVLVEDVGADIGLRLVARFVRDRVPEKCRWRVLGVQLPQQVTKASRDETVAGGGRRRDRW
jgi:hypothetical protein